MATGTIVKTTRSGRPKVAPLDRGRILAEQAEQIGQELAAITGADARKVAEARLRRLSEIEADAHAVVAELETPMKKQALSLALHEGARGVYQAIGLSREAFSRMTAEALGDKVPNPKKGQKGQPDYIYVWAERPAAWDEAVVARAKKKKVSWHRYAVHTLPELATKVVTAKVQMDVVRHLRDPLVRELFEVHHLKRAEIAEIIGRNPSRVSQIRQGGGD